MKNRSRDFSFRIGTTSYIYPGNMLENIERLKGTVEDIELLYFEQGYSVEKDSIKKLMEITEEYGLTYTIHLPLDLDFSHTTELVRSKSVDDVLRIFREVSDLNPESYILHLNRNSNNLINNCLTDSLNAVVSNMNNPEKTLY
ncbi:cobamide remodeling phosphodiesterase CbiR [Elusimicrobiota bacterium]